MSAQTPLRSPSLGRRFLRFTEKLDDGQILRTVFYSLLIGTVCVLAIDYFELRDAATDQQVYQPSAQPVLPASDHPAGDEANPSYAPQTELVTPPEILGQPLEISLKPGGLLEIEGTIIPGAAKKLAEELEARGEYIQAISLNSPGGIVDEALQMGRLIRDAGLDTFVGAGKLCGSSCPLILAGGLNRSAEEGAAIGVHQIYAGTSDREISAAQSLSNGQTVTAGIVRHLTEMDIDAALWVHAMETPPRELYYLTPEELETYRLTGSSEEET